MMPIPAVDFEHIPLMEAADTVAGYNTVVAFEECSVLVMFEPEEEEEEEEIYYCRG